MVSANGNVCSYSGTHHGHYVSAIKSFSQWLLFDDDEIRVWGMADSMTSLCVLMLAMFD